MPVHAQVSDLFLGTKEHLEFGWLPLRRRSRCLYENLDNVTRSTV